MRHTEISLRATGNDGSRLRRPSMVGLIASRLLPLEKFPDIEFPGIFIQIPYDGLDARGGRAPDHAPGRGGAGNACPASSRCSRAPAKTRPRSSCSSAGTSRWAPRASRPAPRSTAFATSYPRTCGGSSSSRDRSATSRCCSCAYRQSATCPTVTTLLDRLLKRRLERLEGVSRGSSCTASIRAKFASLLRPTHACAAYGVDITQSCATC